MDLMNSRNFKILNDADSAMYKSKVSRAVAILFIITN